jgi:hypothetical protein
VGERAAIGEYPLIALFGADGRIGSRYRAILKHIGQAYIPIEKDDEINPEKWTHAIIATPTDTHFEIGEFIESLGIPYLLEKPATKDLIEAQRMSLWKNGFIVNNYQFAIPEAKSIEYNFYNTGRDGLKWDCCQLIYLADQYKAKLKIKRESPIWTLAVDDELIPYRQVEYSYIQMMNAFLDEEIENLWPIQRAFEMTKLIQDVDDRQGSLILGDL